MHVGGKDRVALDRGWGRPVGGHEFIGHPAKNKGIHLIEVVDGIFVEFFIHGMPVNFSIGPLVEAIQGDQHLKTYLSHDQPPVRTSDKPPLRVCNLRNCWLLFDYLVLDMGYQFCTSDAYGFHLKIRYMFKQPFSLADGYRNNV